MAVPLVLSVLLCFHLHSMKGLFKKASILFVVVSLAANTVLYISEIIF